MAAIALLKFSQGTKTPDAGKALIVDPSVQVNIENGGDNSGVQSWKVELLDGPVGSLYEISPGSPVELNQNPAGSVPTASIIPASDATPGCYRIRLRVWTGTDYNGSMDEDIRNICVRCPNRHVVLPPYQKLPDPLPLPGENQPNSKPDELNFDGQQWGWSGPDYLGVYGQYGYFRLVNSALSLLDSLSGGGSLVPDAAAFGQQLYWDGSIWQYTTQVFGAPTYALGAHTVSMVFDQYRKTVELVGVDYQSVPGYAALCTTRTWVTDHYEPYTRWQALPTKAINQGPVRGQVLGVWYDTQDADYRSTWSRAAVPPDAPTGTATVFVWDDTQLDAYWYNIKTLPSGVFSGAVLWWDSINGKWINSNEPGGSGYHLQAGWNSIGSYYYAEWVEPPGTVPDGTLGEYGEMLVWRNDQWEASSIPPDQVTGYIPYMQSDQLNWLPVPAGTTDELVKVSATDSTAQFLSDKLTNGTGISIATLGSPEQLEITNSAPETFLVKATAADTNPTALDSAFLVFDPLHLNPQGVGDTHLELTIDGVSDSDVGYVTYFPAGSSYLFGSNGSAVGGTWTRNIDSYIDVGTIDIDKLIVGGDNTVLITNDSSEAEWKGGTSGQFLGISAGSIGFYSITGTVADGTSLGQMLWWNGSAWTASQSPSATLLGVPYYNPNGTEDVYWANAGPSDGVLRWYAGGSSLGFMQLDATLDIIPSISVGGVLTTIDDGGGGRTIVWSGSAPADNYVFQWTGDPDEGPTWIPPGTVWADGAPAGSDTEDVLRWNGSAWAAGDAYDPNAIHDNEAGEIAAITEKASPVGADWLVIEDSESVTPVNQKKRVQIGNLPVTGEINTASNVGTDGVGVYYQKTGVNLEFRHVAPGSSKVTTTLNGQDIDVDIVESNIIHQNLSGAGTYDHSAIDSHIGSTSNPHAVTIGQAVAQTLSPTRGDILYYGASGWALLSAGADGQHLESNGASTDPTWETPATYPSGTGTDNHIVRWNGTTNIQNSTASIDDNGVLHIDLNGSSTGSPGGMSWDNLSSGEAYRWSTAGNDGIQSVFDGAVTYYCWNTMIFRGGRATTPPSFDANQANYSAMFINQQTGLIALAVRGASGQVDRLQTWENSSGTELSAIDENGNLLLRNQHGVYLYELTTNGTNNILLRAPASFTSNWTLTLPTTAGSSGQFLQNTGSGSTTWASAVTGTGTDNQITRWDGTGAIQGSAVTIADTSGNMSFPDNAMLLWNSVKQVLTYMSSGDTLQVGENSGTDAPAILSLESDTTIRGVIESTTVFSFSATVLDLNVDLDLDGSFDIIDARAITFASLYNAGTMNNSTVTVDPDNGLKQYVTITTTGGSANLQFNRPNGDRPCNFMVKLIKNGAGSFNFTAQSGSSVVAAAGSVDIKDTGTTTLGVFFDGGSSGQFHVTSSPGETTASVNLT